MVTAYLSLGSNVGNRLANIKKALRMLESRVDVQSVSSVYETEPWGLRDQAWFLNVVCSGNTDLDPYDLLSFVKGIERRLGRRKTARYGPRRIDIDILLYDDRVVHLPKLHIPHPRLADRAFVLIPLAEIAPAVEHPETGKTPLEMLAELEEPGSVRAYRQTN